MSLKREIKTSKVDRCDVWELSKNWRYNGSSAMSEKGLKLLKPIADSWPHPRYLHILTSEASIDGNQRQRADWSEISLDEHEARSLRNWLIEQYPLELTELALLKTKMESDQ